MMRRPFCGESSKRRFRVAILFCLSSSSLMTSATEDSGAKIFREQIHPILAKRCNVHELGMPTRYQQGQERETGWPGLE